MIQSDGSFAPDAARPRAPLVRTAAVFRISLSRPIGRNARDLNHTGIKVGFAGRKRGSPRCTRDLSFDYWDGRTNKRLTGTD